MEEEINEYTIEYNTPKAKEFGEMIRAGIEQYGWDEFERLFVKAAGLVLAKEENGKRYYEHPDHDDLKITIGIFTE